MSLPITPENFAAVLIAAGTGASAVLTAIGGWALWRKQKEPPPPGSPDAVVVALAENTRGLQSMIGQFGQNLQLFGAIVDLSKQMADDIEEMRRLTQQIEQHQAAIRDATNRRTR